MKMRIGHGFDVHRFGTGAGPIVIGGARVPSEHCLIAHSDGDVLLHALCDALLGALAMGDIGHLYPDSDDRFLGIDSRELLRDVASRINAAGWRVSNADMTIIAQVPKMAPYEEEMRCNIASDLDREARLHRALRGHSLRGCLPARGRLNPSHVR